MKLTCLIFFILIAISWIAVRAAPAQDSSESTNSKTIKTFGHDGDQSQVTSAPPEHAVLTGPLETKDSQKEAGEFFEEEKPEAEKPESDTKSDEWAASGPGETPDSAVLPATSKEPPSGTSEVPHVDGTSDTPPTDNASVTQSPVTTSETPSEPSTKAAETPSGTSEGSTNAPSEIPTNNVAEAPTAPAGTARESTSETPKATGEPKPDDLSTSPASTTTESPPSDTSSASPAEAPSNPAPQETREPVSKGKSEPSTETKIESNAEGRNGDETSFDLAEKDETQQQEPTNQSQESEEAEAKSVEPSEQAENSPSQTGRDQPAAIESTTTTPNELTTSPTPPEKGDKPQLQTGPLINAGELAKETPKSAEANRTVVSEHDDNKIQAPATEYEDFEESKQEKGDYRVDLASCSAYANESSINAVVETILKKLASKQCAQVSNGSLKLRPATNKQIVGYVMETSSVPLEISTLIRAQMTYASCVASTNFSGNSSELDQPATKSFKLRLDQELDDGYLTSSWRMYKRLAQDDLPSGVFKSLESLKARSFKNQHRAPVVTKSLNKCQRFTVERGEYYLELLIPKTSSLFDVQLGAIGVEGNSTNSTNATDHAVSLIEFNVTQLYLDHGLQQSSFGTNAADAQADGLANQYPSRRQQTTQIFHTNNSHFRRNHWLLELYANWLKHEYRTQLRHLVSSQLLVDQLNECLKV